MMASHTIGHELGAHGQPRASGNVPSWLSNESLMFQTDLEHNNFAPFDKKLNLELEDKVY